MAGYDTVDPDVAWYYERGRERERLSTTARLEFLRTQELFGTRSTRALPMWLSGHSRTLGVGERSGSSWAYACALGQGSGFRSLGCGGGIVSVPTS